MFDELFAALGDALGVVVPAAAVAFFLFMVVVIWMWRQQHLREG